jgi:hypothetical protein
LGDFHLHKAEANSPKLRINAANKGVQMSNISIVHQSFEHFLLGTFHSKSQDTSHSRMIRSNSDPIRGTQVKIGTEVRRLKMLLPALMLATITTSTAVQKALPELKPFTSMCISDDSIGYSFQGRLVTRTIFPVDASRVIRKLESKLYSDPESNGYAECDLLKKLKPEIFPSGDTWTYACYDFRNPKHGTRPIASLCTEKWDKNGTLIQIVCEKYNFAFNPFGAFVTRSSVDIESVVYLETGKCSPID